MADTPAPPRRSAVDAALLLTLLAFAATSLLFDRAAALDWVGPDTADPFGRALYHYAMRFDPLVADNPLFLRVMSGISAFVFGPFYLWAAHALRRGDPRLHGAALVYMVAMEYSMLVHIAVELWGELPPPDLLVFALVYAPYCILPVALWRRTRPAAPA
ncbi:MAG: emopamil-binding family protein [Nannocystaceae bacterium]|jgi:hypothetical protein